jgi:NADPH:quinone reductase-like Zn-dependent oxidoreductase
MGSDAAGTIESIGQLAADRSDFKIGDDVFVVPFRSCRRCTYCLAGEEQLCQQYKILGRQIPGTQAEYIVAPVDYLMSKPKDLSWEETAAFPLAYLTAYHMLAQKTKINPLDWILIWGASSGIGSAAIQFAKLFGARIIATASSDEKVEFALKLGCDFVVNYTAESVSQCVKEFTEGMGVDIVFEHVGQESWDHSLRALKKGGKIVTCGATTGALVSIDIRHIYIKHQQIIGSTMGNRNDLLEIVKLLEAGKIKPIVYKSLHFDRIKEAHKLLHGNKQKGKIVITF